MATDLGVGDTELPFLDVAPAAGDTVVTLAVNPPSGTPYDITMSAGPLVAIPDTSPTEYTCRFTAATPVAYDQAGRWVLHYEVTGTGEGAEDFEQFVVASPVAGGPTWIPGRSRVAAYVPHRTLVRSTATTVTSADAYAWTFDSTTTPPGTTVDRLIMDGVAWVTAQVTPMHANSEPVAALLSALWAAIFIERAWQHDDSSLQRALDMERQLNSMLAGLVKSNDDANDGDYGLDAAAIWSFPPADTRYDSACYW